MDDIKQTEMPLCRQEREERMKKRKMAAAVLGLVLLCMLGYGLKVCDDKPEGKKVGGKTAMEYHMGKYSEAGQKNWELSQMTTEILEEKREK